MTTVRRFLGLETSCDETAAAVFTEEPRILSSVVASQHQVHAPFGGVVPELAARAHIRNLLPVIRRALEESNTKLEDLSAIAVHNRPGLVGALSLCGQDAEFHVKNPSFGREPLGGACLCLPACCGEKHISMRRPNRKRRAHPTDVGPCREQVGGFRPNER